MPNRVGKSVNKQGIQGTGSASEIGTSSRNPVRKNATPTAALASGQRQLTKINAKEYDNIKKMHAEAKVLEQEKQALVAKIQKTVTEETARETDSSRLRQLFNEGARLERILLSKQKELISKMNTLRSKVGQFTSSKEILIGKLKEDLNNFHEQYLNELVVRQIAHHANIIGRFQAFINSKKNENLQSIDLQNSQAVELQNLNQKLVQATLKKQVEESKNLVEFFEDIPEGKRNLKVGEHSANDIAVSCFTTLIYATKSNIADAQQKAFEEQRKISIRTKYEKNGIVLSLTFPEISQVNETEKNELEELYTAAREALVELMSHCETFQNYSEKILTLPIPETKKDLLQREKNQTLRIALNAQFTLISNDINQVFLSHSQAKISSNDANKLDVEMPLLASYRSLILNVYNEYQKNQAEHELTLTRQNYQIAQSILIACDEIAQLSSNIAARLESENFPQKDLFQTFLKNIESDSFHFQRLIHEEINRLNPVDPLEDMDSQQASSEEDDGGEMYLHNLFEKHFVKQGVEEDIADIADAIADADLISESEAAEVEAAKHEAGVHVTAESNKLRADIEKIKKRERKLDKECKWHERKSAEYRNQAREQLSFQSLSSMQMYMRMAIEEIKKIFDTRIRMANEFQSILSSMEKNHPDYQEFLDKEEQLRKEAAITTKTAHELAAEGKKLLVNALREKCVVHPPSSNDFRTLHDMGAIAKIVPSPRKVDDKLDKDGNVLKNPYTDEPAKDYFQSFEIHLKGEAQVKDGTLSFAPVKKGTKKDISFVAHFHYKDADSEDILAGHFKTKEQANKGSLYAMSENEAGRDVMIHRSPFKKSEDVIHIIKTMSEKNMQGKGKEFY